MHGVVDLCHTEVLTQQLRHCVMRLPHVFLDLELPLAGGFEHFADVQPHIQPCHLACVERGQNAFEVTVQRLAQAQPRLGEGGNQRLVGTQFAGEKGAVQRRLVAEVIADGGDIGVGLGGDRAD